MIAERGHLISGKTCKVEIAKLRKRENKNAKLRSIREARSRKGEAYAKRGHENAKHARSEIAKL